MFVCVYVCERVPVYVLERVCHYLESQSESVYVAETGAKETAVYKNGAPLHIYYMYMYLSPHRTPALSRLVVSVS